MIYVKFYDCTEGEDFGLMGWRDEHLSRKHMKAIVSELYFACNMMCRKRVIADIFFKRSARELMKGICPYTGDITVSIIDFKEKYGCATVFINCNEILREFQLI